MKISIYLLLTIVMIYSSVLISMDTKIKPAYTTCLAKSPYYKSCIKKTDIEQEQKMKDFISLYSKYATIEAGRTIIKNKLKKQLHEIKTIEENNLSKLKKQFSINDSTWNYLLKLNQEIQNFEETHKHLPLPDITHDKTIPKMFRNILKTCLVEKGINPKRINILMNSYSRYAHFTPTALWSLDTELTFSTECHAGVIMIDNSDYPFEIQKALGLLFAYLIDSKKLATYCNIGWLAQLFNSSCKSVVASKYFTRYIDICMPLTMVELALKDLSTASIMCAALKKIQFNIHDASYFYKQVAKIKKYWQILEWLNNYNYCYTSIIAEKNPTIEEVTYKELMLWKKNNDNPLCLPLRGTTPERIAKSYNPFNVLEKPLSNRYHSKQLEEILYNFLQTVIDKKPIYEHQIPSSELLSSLKLINSEECSIKYLIEIYTKESVEKIVEMANSYALKNNKSLIILPSIY